jgi:hypothetical protein
MLIEAEIIESWSPFLNGKHFTRESRYRLDGLSVIAYDALSRALISNSCQQPLSFPILLPTASE